jgi:hypothetical protein
MPTMSGDGGRVMRKGIYFVLFVSVFFSAAVVAGDYLGQLSANPYLSESTANPYGAGSPYRADGVKNPYSEYGSRYSNNSVSSPYATNAPKLYDSEGNYRGRLSSNPYDPESTSNPYGRYGSAYSAESINNPYGAGSRYRADSPTNPYGTGWKIEGQGGVEASAHSAASEAPASAWAKLSQPADGSGSYSQTDSPADIDTDF